MLDALVLVVDDNPETLDLMAFALESEGFRVRKAKTVLKALELLHDVTTRPNLILTDLVMPQTSGRDFLKSTSMTIAVSGSVPLTETANLTTENSTGNCQLLNCQLSSF